MIPILNYFDTAFPTGKPVWTTENKVVYDHPAFSVRCFREGREHPTLIIPPQAGHSSTIADYDEGQSLVETVLEARPGRGVYCIEWKSCTQDRKMDSISDLFAYIDMAKFTISEGTIHLIGLCQGGWLAAMYASLVPCLSLTCIASPIDFHIDGGVIYDTITKLGMGPYEDYVRYNHGIMPGDLMLTGWKMMHAYDRYVGDYFSIWDDAMEGNTKKLKKVKRFRTWYENTQDLAGVWYLEAVENLFLKNELIKGQFSIGHWRVNLENIKCPIAMIAGENDDITLQNQLFALGDGYRKVIPNCGHVGCFMGSRSQAYLVDTIEWLTQQVA